MEKMMQYIKLMRPKHCLKNLVTFLPLFFSGEIMDGNKLVSVVMAFISFSLLSSAVYCYNDIRDAEKDKAHPIKRNRPIAAGRISKGSALGCMLMLIILAFGINILWCNASIETLMITTGLEVLYLLLNIAYSCGLKTIPVMDVIILVSGFIIRLFYGAQIVSVVISDWLYLTVMAGGFYMGFGKRRNEMIKQGDKSREVLGKYNKEFLEKFMYVSLILIIVFYSLWCIDKDTISRIGNDYMIVTIPMVLIILMKYSWDIEQDSFGDPVDVITNDKVLMTLVTCFALILAGILYL